MGYGYAYGYGLASAQNPAQLYAAEQAALYVARVTADGGTVQNRFAVEGIYRLLYEQGLTTVRRYYSALGGVKLNDLGGGNFGVQTWYDLNNTAPVDATQGTGANQPLWSLDTDTGFRVPLFDGSNDFMSVNDLGIFNAQSAGTIVAVAKDLNRTGGDASHVVIQISTALGNTRAGITTRDSSLSEFRANARKLDADAIVSSTSTSANGYNYLAGSYLWSSNLLRLTANGTEATAGNFIGASTTTSATDSATFTIGAANATTNRLNGYAAELPIFRTALSTAQIAAFREFYKRYYPTLP